MSEYPEVCLISGGSSGIGLATALKFVECGSKVAICSRDPEKLTDAHDQLVASSSDEQVLALDADLTITSDAERFVAEAISKFGRVDLLVNNAAMAPLAAIDEMQDEIIDQCIDLNIRGVYVATRAAWKQMKEQKSGLIVNISSQAAVDPFPGVSLYGATKAWVELLTVALAGEGREHGIRSYCIRPGAVETPMLRGLFADFPAEQCVSPDEIADAIMAVCGPAFSNSSGQVVKVSRQ